MVEICKHADFNTNKQLRLVNHNFEAAASEVVFEVVYFAPLADSIRHLALLKSSSELAKHVKKIVYINFRLNFAFEDFPVWKAHALYIATDTISPEHMERYRCFKGLCKGQRRVCYNRADSDVLKDCIQYFPNLTSVKVRSLSSMGNWPEGGKRPIVDKVFPLTLVKHPFIGPPASVQSWSRPQIAILEGFVKAGRSIEKLDLSDMVTTVWEDIQFPALLAPIQGNIGTAFKNLKSLTLTTWIANTRPAHDPLSAVARFNVFLSAAPALEILSLDILAMKHRAKQFSRMPRVDLSGVCDTVSWKKLRVLHLSNFHVFREQLTAFILQHANSLECLCLRRIYLKEATATDACSLVPGQEHEYEVSWECMTRQLRGSMNNLQLVDFREAVDGFLSRKYIEIHDNPPADDAWGPSCCKLWIASLDFYCRQLAGHLLLGGEHTIPRFRGPTPSCDTCTDRLYQTGHGNHSNPMPEYDWSWDNTGSYESDEEDGIVPRELIHQAYYDDADGYQEDSDDEDDLGRDYYEYDDYMVHEYLVHHNRFMHHLLYESTDDEEEDYDSDDDEEEEGENHDEEEEEDDDENDDNDEEEDENDEDPEEDESNTEQD